MDFKDKIVLVTGGSRGIGKAIALEFASMGAHIIFNYLRNHLAATQTESEIENMGVQCLKIRAHLGNPEKIQEMFSVIRERFDRLDVLVNNAASGVQRHAVDLEEKHWDWAMNINAKAPWLCSIEASQLMTEGSSIVNITSQGSQKVLPFYLSVGTSKAALESLTRYLAVELAPKGISVNAVSGGYVETGALDYFPNKEKMTESGRNIPAGRRLTGQDIAKVVTFLCGDEASMIRGQVITVDGGATFEV